MLITINARHAFSDYQDMKTNVDFRYDIITKQPVTIHLKVFQKNGIFFLYAPLAPP